LPKFSRFVQFPFPAPKIWYDDHFSGAVVQMFLVIYSTLQNRTIVPGSETYYKLQMARLSHDRIFLAKPRIMYVLAIR
jgi:hypothetical protein